MDYQIKKLYSFLIYNNINPNQFEIVIARYNEDLKPWLILKDFIIVYNKGEPINSSNLNLNLKIKNISNVGRESHTYLYHIIENYNNLKYLTLFIQADFSDHMKEIYELYEYLIKVNKIKINLKNKNTCCFNGWGRLNHKAEYLKMIYDNKLILAKYTFGEWWLKYISNKLLNLNDFRWGPCGIFSVTRETIISLDLNYYKNIINSINYHSNPEEGHYCERSWYYIFRGGKIN